MTYCDIVCAMNSVSKVACISAGSVYLARDWNAERSDEDILVTRWERTLVSKGFAEDGGEEADVDVPS